MSDQEDIREQIERAALASCMHEAEGKIADYYIDNGLNAEWFLNGKLRIIWDQIVALRAGGSSCDEVAVTMRGSKADFGFDHRIIPAIMNTVETDTHHRSYLERLRELYKQRVIARAGKVLSEGAEGGRDPDELLAEFKDITSAFDSSERQMASAKDFIPEALQKLKDGGKEALGIPTGFPDLDAIIGGLGAQQLIIVAARPGIGKTTIAVNIADHVAVKLKEPTAIFSMEMTKHELGQRMLTARARISKDRIVDGAMNGEKKVELSTAEQELANAPLWVHDRKAQTVEQIASKCRRMKNKHGLSLVVIDYLSLIKPAHNNRNSRREEVDEISRNLKELAGSVDCPVLCMAQLNRDVEKTGRRPRMSDLREAGGIEQDADKILALHVPEESEENIIKVECLVLKNRNNPTGSIDLNFIKYLTKFESRVRQ